ncbi:MAG: hypothetical protein ACYSSP_10650 [Planctomycetota bacterium]|jgi:hypothetical protein
MSTEQKEIKNSKDVNVMLHEEESLGCQIDNIMWKEMVDRSLDCDGDSLKEALDELFEKEWSETISRDKFNDRVRSFIGDHELRVENIQTILDRLRELLDEEEERNG